MNVDNDRFSSRADNGVSGHDLIWNGDDKAAAFHPKVNDAELSNCGDL